MKKRFLKAISAALALVLPLSVAAACGGRGTTQITPGGDGTRPAGQKIVIYAGGSSEFSWVKGTPLKLKANYLIPQTLPSCSGLCNCM